MSTAVLESKNKKLGFRLALLGVAMIPFSVFLYWSGSALCDYFGLSINPDNSDTDAVASADTEGQITGRYLKIYMKARSNEAFAGKVQFWVDEKTQRVEVGRYQKAMFHIKNTSKETLYIRPIHWVSPNKAATEFMMIECFCYNDMALKPGEQRDLPVTYGFKPELDPRIRQADVQYTIEPITRLEMREQQGMPNKGAFKPGGDKRMQEGE